MIHKQDSNLQGIRMWTALCHPIILLCGAPVDLSTKYVPN